MRRAPILIVDDDPSVLSALKRLLRARDFKSDTTTSPKEALKWMADYAYAVVISDHRMPEISGLEFLSKVKIIQPSSFRILMTGYGDETLLKKGVNNVGIFRYISKPWDRKFLFDSVKEAFEKFFLLHDQSRAYESELRRNKELQTQYQKIGKKVLERDERIMAMSGELEEKFLYSVRLMSQLIENYSPDLSKHSNRVALLAAELASDFKLSGRKILEIEIAASLHDIGKIGLPESLLKKRLGEFSESELLQYMKHTTRAGEMLKDTPNFEAIAAMIKHHHEHFDGSGYPFKLKGEAIPLGARIIAVADAYDNAVNGRSVFAQPNSESALVYIKAKCPSYFDPQVLSALVRYLASNAEAENTNESELQISLAELEAGMVLTRNLTTASGRQILPKGSVIETRFLIRLLDMNRTDPIVDSIFVQAPQVKSDPAA